MSLPAPTVKVFIAGASYAGLSAALNLLDLGSGLNPRLTKGAPYAHHHDLPRVNFQITLVDERDGFRACPSFLSCANVYLSIFFLASSSSTLSFFLTSLSSCT